MLAVIKKASLFLLMTGWCVLASADEHEDQDMADLLAMLEEETAVATQSKMNADYVPGMVTVLHGEDLQSYGVSTVMDALDQVAGFYMTVNNAGDNVAIVRGIGTSMNASNLKILINGVAVNRPVDASADWALRLPIAQVDRIEIIRGPGSALYGEFAFAGVVNIITLSANSIGIKLGSHQLKQGDALYSHTFNTGAQLSVNLSAWDRDNSGRQTNPDNFAGTNHGYSPGSIYDHEQGQVLFASANHHGFQVQMQLADVERGGWYGANAAMPQDLDPRKEKVTSIQLKKNWELSDNLQLSASLESLQTRLDHATYLPIPKGIDPPGPPPAIITDTYRQDGSKDSTQRANLNLHWSASDEHQLFVDLSHVSSKVDSSYVARYELGLPRIYGTPDKAAVLAGSKRQLSSLTLQDQWQINNQLELTLGARYDHYSDWGSNTSPRIAAVWRASEKHIFKAQFAEAFRPPTMAEQYPGPNTFPDAIFTDLKQESLSSTELAYIYHEGSFKFRSTLFKTQIKDLIEFFINPGEPPIWRNRGDLDTSGIELEWQQNVERDWDWFANLSYVNARDHLDTDGELTGSVNWLANLGAIWRVTADTRHALQTRYVGQQEGWEIQTAQLHTQRYSGYTLLDYTLTMDNLFDISSLSLSASINNLLDRHFNSVPNPAQFPTGLPNGERTGWLQIYYRF